jgi:hypothetical protein
MPPRAAYMAGFHTAQALSSNRRGRTFTLLRGTQLET